MSEKITKKENILITKNNSLIIAHYDENKSTSYICGHVMRIATESKNENLKYTGFIHIPKEPKEEQFYEVLALSIKGFINKLNLKENTILITGFTKFGEKVPDNATSRLLFGDGVSIDEKSFGLKLPLYNKIDFFIKKELEGFLFIANYKDIGRTYIYQDKKINLLFLRLPVDDKFENIIDENKNPIGDRTGKILKDTISSIKPNAVLSFGVGLYKPEEENHYHIETRCYGYLKAKELGCYSSQEYLDNYDLKDVFLSYK